MRDEMLKLNDSIHLYELQMKDWKSKNKKEPLNDSRSDSNRKN